MRMRAESASRTLFKHEAPPTPSVKFLPERVLRVSQATLPPFFGLDPPLVLGLLLAFFSPECSGPPSLDPLCLLTSGFAGLTSNGLLLPCGVNWDVSRRQPGRNECFGTQ